MRSGDASNLKIHKNKNKKAKTYPSVLYTIWAFGLAFLCENIPCENGHQNRSHLLLSVSMGCVSAVLLSFTSIFLFVVVFLSFCVLFVDSINSTAPWCEANANNDRSLQRWICVFFFLITLIQSLDDWSRWYVFGFSLLLLMMLWFIVHADFHFHLFPFVLVHSLIDINSEGHLIISFMHFVITIFSPPQTNHINWVFMFMNVLFKFDVVYFY